MYVEMHYVHVKYNLYIIHKHSLERATYGDKSVKYTHENKYPNQHNMLKAVNYAYTLYQFCDLRRFLWSINNQNICLGLGPGLGPSPQVL